MYSLVLCNYVLQYKQKRAKSDPESVKLEGQLTTDWFALDLGKYFTIDLPLLWILFKNDAY